MLTVVRRLLPLFFALVLCSCGGGGKVIEQAKGDLDIKSVFYLPATIERVDGAMVTFSVDKPTVASKKDKLALQLAQAIIDNSYILEGKETRLGGQPIRVQRVGDDRVLARLLEEGSSLQAGSKHDIFLDRKIIAITDFELLKGNDPDIATYVQEDVTTALVGSGQFNVVERYKLSTVLDEIKLSQSGMVDSRTAKKAGKLLGADLLLTGTLIQVGNNWNANLRLINTETGLIVTAINREGPMAEFAKQATRTTTNIEHTFKPGEEMTG